MFKKAERKQAKLRLGLNGPSGSGKTYSALLIAKGIGGKIAVLDTEKGSASLYSDLFHFDTEQIDPPFTYEKYIRGIEDAEKAKYDVLIIDSLSHAWMGEGGVLEQKAMLDQVNKSNQFANWKKPKEAYTKLKNAIIFSDIHIICTLRAKQAYEQQTDESGRKKIEKMGMEPQTEPGTEYEFTTVLDLNMSHLATTSKDRSSLFDGKIIKPDESTGKMLYEWLMSGKPIWKFGEEQMNLIKMIATEKNITGVQTIQWAGKKMDLLTEVEYEALCDKMRNYSPEHFENYK